MSRSPPPPTWSPPRCVGSRSPRRPRLSSTPTSMANVRATPPPPRPTHAPDAHGTARARPLSCLACHVATRAAPADGLATEDPAWAALAEAADRLDGVGDGGGGDGGGGGGGGGGGDDGDGGGGVGGGAGPTEAGTAVVVSSTSFPLAITAEPTYYLPYTTCHLVLTTHSLPPTTGDARLPTGHGGQRQQLPRRRRLPRPRAHRGGGHVRGAARRAPRPRLRAWRHRRRLLPISRRRRHRLPLARRHRRRCTTLARLDNPQPHS